MISIQTALLRLGLALVLGACVGFERERGERGAGLRTHALVALGSSLVMIISAFGFADLQGVPNVTLDPSRIAAQVVSGIGFIGAGTILLRKEIVKGLTTAAAIWVVAAIGLACGAGLLLEALIVTVFTIAVLTLLGPLRQRVPHLPELSHLRIKVTAESIVLTRVYDICREIGATLEQVEVQTGNGRDKLEIVCATSEAIRLTKSLVALRTESGIETISVNLRNPNTDMALFPLFTEEQSVDSIP
jgi:putative Mg2+ transporter-C (MgtC) family protein